MATSMWQQTEEMAKKHDQGGSLWLKLAGDGDKAVVVFLGEPHPREVAFVDGKYVEVDEKMKAAGTKASLRVALNVALYDSKEVKVLEQGVMFFKDLVRVREKYGLEKWAFEIQRHGAAKDPKTTYSILPEHQLSAEQQKAYPDIVPLITDVAPGDMFVRAESAARAMGWEIVAAVPEEGRIEATDTTQWWGFKDDVVIRITAQGTGSRLDIRSMSRVGESDLGKNADRIRKFLAAIKDAFPGTVTRIYYGSTEVGLAAMLGDADLARKPGSVGPAAIGVSLALTAGLVLFAGVARGFGSRDALRDALVGLALALAVFFFFVKFLNVNLPAGWLKPLLGAAGI